MVDIQSKEVIDKISDDLKVQPSMLIPRELAKHIQLVYVANPGVNDRELQAIEGVTSDSLSSIIFTTHTTKRTFLTGINMTYAKDAVNDGNSSNVLATLVRGNTSVIIPMRYEPTTAGSDNTAILFPVPLELAKGTQVLLNNNSATASIDAGAVVFFFETDPQ